jgi:hypothetical protein
MTAELSIVGEVDSPTPWRVLVPSGAPTVDVPRGFSARPGRGLPEIDVLPSQAAVVLVSRGPFSRARLQKAAGRTGIDIDHEYVVLPGLRSGRYVVEDDPDAVAVLWHTLAAPPPRLTLGTAAATALASLGRRWLPWRALGVVSARVAVGHRR